MIIEYLLTRFLPSSINPLQKDEESRAGGFPRQRALSPLGSLLPELRRAGSTVLTSGRRGSPRRSHCSSCVLQCKTRYRIFAWCQGYHGEVRGQTVYYACS